MRFCFRLGLLVGSLVIAAEVQVVSGPGLPTLVGLGITSDKSKGGAGK